MLFVFGFRTPWPSWEALKKAPPRQSGSRQDIVAESLSDLIGIVSNLWDFGTTPLPIGLLEGLG